MYFRAYAFVQENETKGAGPIRISSSVMKFAVIRSLVLMKLQIFSINERIRMGSESSAKFSTIVGVEEYFL